MENKNKFLEVSQIKDRSKLEVKEVDFVGDGLIAVKNKENGKIYAGVSLVCKGIGFTKDQKDRQVKNVQSDEVLKLGCVKFDAGVIDRNNEVLAIELDYLPLWLAKISLTPKMKKDQPEVVKKLVNYQLKAKDVLAEAFVHKESKPTCIEDVLISSLQEMKAMRQEINSVKEETAATREEITGLREAVTLNPNQWRKDTATLINKIANKLGGFQHIEPIRKEAYKLLNATYGVDINRRLLNKKKNMALEGCSKSKIDKVNYLDVIADDKKLVNGYVNIIGRMAIKYGIKELG